MLIPALVDIDSIKVYEHHKTSHANYDELKESIRVNGLQTGVIVDREMTLIDGHLRYKAVKELGFKVIAVKIYFDPPKTFHVILVSNQGGKIPGHRGWIVREEDATRAIELVRSKFLPEDCMNENRQMLSTINLFATRCGWDEGVCEL